MILPYNTIHSNFKLNAQSYTRKTLKELSYSFVKEGTPFEIHVGHFLLNWLDSKAYIKVHTSGSTGMPKTIQLQKNAMVHSAMATGTFFKLKPSDKALHCLPSNFIAGKMMLVRAMVLGLEIDLVKPSSNPLQNIETTYDFCAMVPLQLQNSMSKLDCIKTLIVGGATVPSILEKQLQKMTTKVYATYGMTETITHIAVKNLSYSVTDYYQTLPNITISKDDRDCLVITAPYLSNNVITTNDIVKLISEHEFELLGRYDNIINSGGIKFMPEQIEKKLQSKISQRFFIASEPDDILGERIILIIEGTEDTLLHSVFQSLEKHETPKAIYYLAKFIKTETVKINRKKTLQLLK